MAGIHPARAAGRVALKRYESLVETIKTVLHDAIDQVVPPCEILWVVMGRRDILRSNSGYTAARASPAGLASRSLKKSGKAVEARFFVRAASANQSGRSTPQSQPDVTLPH